MHLYLMERLAPKSDFFKNSRTDFFRADRTHMPDFAREFGRKSGQQSTRLTTALCLFFDNERMDCHYRLSWIGKQRASLLEPETRAGWTIFQQRIASRLPWQIGQSVQLNLSSHFRTLNFLDPGALPGQQMIAAVAI